MPESISAIGIACALGVDCETVLRKALAGDVSGLSPWREPLVDDGRTLFGYVPLADSFCSKFSFRCDALLAACADQIWGQVGRILGRTRPERVAVVVGTSNSTMDEMATGGPPVDMAHPAAFLRRKLGICGPALTISTACSSGAKVFETARRLMRQGVCEAAIVGGVDAYCRTTVAGFYALEATSLRRCQPMGQGRNGITLGEGAALLVLEREESIGVRLCGVGESSDAYHLTAPLPDGGGAEAAMRLALEDANLSPDEIGYINLHGTGTRQNDLMESLAVSRVFGTEKVRCSSTKPMTGHTLGAAGAIEAALCALMLREGNLLLPHRLDGERDPALPKIPLAAIGERAEVRYALSNSFAFGGSNAALILGKE